MRSADAILDVIEVEVVRNALAAVAAEVVHDHQIAWLKRGNQRFLDIGSKAFAIDRTVDEPRRLDAIVTKRRDKGHGFPMAMGDFRHQSFAPRRPAAQRLHVGLRPGLINEDQALGIDPALALPPLQPPPGDIRSIALAGDDGFF